MKKKKSKDYKEIYGKNVNDTIINKRKDIMRGMLYNIFIAINL